MWQQKFSLWIIISSSHIDLYYLLSISHHSTFYNEAFGFLGYVPLALACSQVKYQEQLPSMYTSMTLRLIPFVPTLLILAIIATSSRRIPATASGVRRVYPLHFCHAHWQLSSSCGCWHGNFVSTWSCWFISIILATAGFRHSWLYHAQEEFFLASSASQLRCSFLLI